MDNNSFLFRNYSHTYQEPLKGIAYLVWETATRVKTRYRFSARDTDNTTSGTPATAMTMMKDRVRLKEVGAKGSDCGP